MISKAETLQDKLTKFHSAFGHPIDESFPPPNHKIHNLKKLRRDLIKEEYHEVMDAIKNKSDEEVLKELCDLVYVCVGMCVSYGWDFDIAFNRVHNSNMSKLNDEGKPIYREDGKVLKSDNYKPPSMKGLV
jgi:predicted HAD superfamily Cof-like phosphohydrolase|tara:strand:+ start:606 stop:998 length:393 start_codon:yes stop_codon:yes gene_type:complete